MPRDQRLIATEWWSHSAPFARLGTDESGPIVEKRVRRALKLRRKREALFGANLFGEPAWDMLLQLYATTLAGGRESVTSLCLASAAPMTTALRTLEHLEDRGWIQRQRDESDRRRSFLSLSGKAVAALESLFRTTNDDALA